MMINTNEKTGTKKICRRIIDKIPIPIVELDENLMITLANIEAIRRWPSLGKKGRFFYEVLFSEEKKPDDCFMKKTFKLKKPQSAVVKTDRGEVFEVKTSYMDLEGVTRIWAHIFDITEQKKAEEALGRRISERKRVEEALWKSETRYRDLFENLLEGVYQTLPDGKILSVNPALIKILGYDSEEEFCTSVNARDLYINPGDRKKFIRELEEKGELRNVELDFKCKDGREIVVLENARVVRDKKGEISHFEGLLMDITERKHSEELITHAKQEWEQTFDCITELIMILDEKFTIRRVNRPMTDRLGITPQEAIGKKCYEIIHGMDKPPDFCPHVKMLEDGLDHTTEIHEKHLNGDFIVNVSPLHNIDGKIINAVHVAIDITERKQTEFVLKENEERYRHLVENATDLIYKADERGYFTFFNTVASSIMKEPVEKLIGKHFLDFIRSDYKKKAERFYLIQLMRKITNTYLEVPVLTKDGQEIWLGQKVHLDMEGDQVIGFQSVARDVTERKRAEEALKESQERFKQLFESAQEGIAIADNNHRLVHVNSEFTRIFGYSKEEAVGKLIDDLIAPQEMKVAAERISTGVLDGRRVATEGIRKCKDGSKIFVSILASPIKVGREQVGIYGIYRDISEQKRAEEDLKKFAEVQEVLVREVNHRVKNNLTAIISMLHMEEDRSEEEGITSSLPIIRELVSRIQGLSTVHSLLSESGWRSLSLGHLCIQIIKAAIHSVPLSKKIDFEVADSNINVNSNQAHHLAMVINEVTTNSLKHALSNRDSAKINVEIKQKGRQVSIHFRDDGPGFPEEMIQGDFSKANVGFELIRGVMIKTLGGEVHIKNKNGAVTTLIFENEGDPVQKE